MGLSRIFLLSILILVSFESYAGIFGPSDPRECLIKHQKKVRLEDAKNLLMFACGVGYGGNVNNVAEKVGRCITSEASEFYSFESTLKIINKCTKNIENGGAFFNLFRDKLYESVNASAEMKRRQQLFDEEAKRKSEDGPISIYDSSTGTFKNCFKTGNAVSCF